MNAFEQATLNTLDRDYQMRELLNVLGPDPNYWPVTIRNWAVEHLLAALDQEDEHATSSPPTIAKPGVQY